MKHDFLFLAGMLLVQVLLATAALANEPLWTLQERAKQRAAVVRGVVVKTTKVKAIDAHADLMSAELRIEGVEKSHESLPKTEVLTIYYVVAAQGVGRSCPAHAELTPGQKGTFYLCHYDNLTGKKDFILQMRSDVVGAK